MPGVPSMRQDEPTERCQVPNVQPSIGDGGARDARVGMPPSVIVPVSSDTPATPGAPGTPQVNLPASAPGTSISTSQGAIGKAAAGFLKTALGKIVIGVLTVAVVTGGVMTAAPIIARSMQQGHDTSATHPSLPARATEKMPPTETSCPPNGKARPMVSAYLARGKSNNLFYFDSTSGETLLKRYNPATRQISTVLSLHQTLVTEVQVSGDGQWILFLAWSSTAWDPTYGYKLQFPGKLQVVRADGQGLQTLICADQTIPSQSRIGSFDIGAPSWSPDNKHIAFDYSITSTYYTPARAGTGILDTGDGSLYDAYPAKTIQDNLDYVAPLVWVDNTHLAVAHHFYDYHSSSSSLFGVYLLDTAQKRAYTSIKQLKQLVDEGSTFCWDYAFAPDMRTLYSSDCPGNQEELISRGTSHIVTHLLNGTTPRPLLSKSTPPIFYATHIVAVTRTSIFFQVAQETSGPGYSIWRVNLDGTGLKQVIGTNTADHYVTPWIKTPWTNISRDMAWLSITDNSDNNKQRKLQVLSPDSGSVTTLVTYSTNENLILSITIAGWTQL